MPLRTVSAKVWAALAAVYIVWGSTYLAIRFAVETLPPFLMAAARWLVAGGILYAWSIRRGDRSDRPTAEHWRNAAVIGAALCFGGNGLVAVAENRISSGAAALLVATVPLWLATLEWLRFRVRLSRWAVAGILIGFGGTAILVLPGGEGAVDVTGAGLVLLASLLWSAGSLFARRAALPARPLLGAGMQMIAGGVVLVVAGAIGGEFGRLDLEAASAKSLLAVGYLALFGSIVGFSSYVWALRNAPTSLVSTYAYVNPVVAVLLGAAFASEAITTTTIVGGLVIVVAVAIIVTATGGGARAPDEVAPAERPDLASEQLPA